MLSQQTEQSLLKLYQTSFLTPQQSGEFNTLLSKISQNLSVTIYIASSLKRYPIFLDSAITTEPQTLLTNWKYLLHHLYQVVLPEMYVFFHDDSTESIHRLRLHQYLAQLYKTSLRWQGSHRQEMEFDNYVIGRGRYAGIACEILPIAKLSNILGFEYLENVHKLIDVCQSDRSLKTFLLREPLKVQHGLQSFQQGRLVCFSQPSADVLANQSELLLIGRNHPLIDYLLHNYSQSQHLSTSINSEKQQLLSKHTNINDELTQKDNETYGSTLFLILSAVIILFSGNFAIAILASVIGVIIAHLATVFIQNKPDLKLNFQKDYKKHIEHRLVQSGKFLLFLALIPFIFDFSGTTTLFIYSLASAIGLTAYQLNRNDLLLIELGKYLNENKDTEKKRKRKPIKNSLSKSNVVDIQGNYSSLIPLKVNLHAKNLQKILSVPASEILQKLIETVNELHDCLDYLQEQHPYLATSVHELIMDIITNSVLRLDQVAKTFVKEGQVKTSAKRLFAQQHEAQIVELFQQHIQEIQALHQSILEKQMAGFSQMGTKAERCFRDRVMELKILLRWYIAQQPDEFSATSHQVILDSLQNTTLKQMMDRFYHPDTTDLQRKKLQTQIDDILAHFKSHSPMLKVDNGEELLKIAYDPNISIDIRLTKENLEAQMVTQDFIDFNEQYIKQLKKHW